jgi:hypothetical protein
LPKGIIAIELLSNLKPKKSYTGSSHRIDAMEVGHPLGRDERNNESQQL